MGAEPLSPARVLFRGVATAIVQGHPAEIGDDSGVLNVYRAWVFDACYGGRGGCDG